MLVLEKTLKNKLRLQIIDTKSYPSCTVLIQVGAGSRYEREDNNGIAHFFEHMVFKGTKKYPSAFAISALLESLGGVFNAYTDKDHTGYWMKAPTEHVKTIIGVLADMVQNPLLPDEEITRERNVIFEEMNMYEDIPARKVGDIYEHLLYEGTPLGLDIIGTKQSVGAATRKTFTEYIDSYYTPENCVVTVAGGLSSVGANDLISILEEAFGSWKHKPLPKRSNIRDTQSEPACRVVHKKTEQAHFCLGFRTFSYLDKRKYILSVLTAILGGGMASRLFTEVRERRGLCYYISTSRELYHDVGNMVTQAGVATKVDTVREAVSVTMEQFRDIKAGNISDDELTRAKEMIRGRLILSLEDSQSVATVYNTRQLLENSIISPPEIIEYLMNVSKEDIITLANEFCTRDTLNFATIGPFEQKQFESFIRELEV